MTIEFHCPHCDRSLKTADDKAGRKAKCPGCSQIVTVPQPAPPQDDEFDFGTADFSYEESAAPVVGAPPPVARRKKGSTKTCPMCGGQVKADATRCRYCGEELKPETGGARGHRTIEAGDILSRAWTIYKAQFGTCVGGILLGNIIINLASAPANVLSEMIENGAFRQDQVGLILAVQFVLVLLAFCVQMFIGLGQNMLLLKIARGEHAEVGDLFKGGPYLLRMIGNSILFGLMLTIGFLMLIIPGIFVALMFWPYVYVLIDQDAPGIQPLARAKDITSGNLGAVFVLGLAGFGINLLGVLACCVGLIFSIPLSMLVFAVAYVAMTGQRTAA